MWSNVNIYTCIFKCEYIQTHTHTCKHDRILHSCKNKWATPLTRKNKIDRSYTASGTGRSNTACGADPISGSKIPDTFPAGEEEFAPPGRALPEYLGKPSWFPDPSETSLRRWECGLQKWHSFWDRPCFGPSSSVRRQVQTPDICAPSLQEESLAAESTLTTETQDRASLPGLLIEANRITGGTSSNQRQL